MHRTSPKGAGAGPDRSGINDAGGAAAGVAEGETASAFASAPHGGAWSWSSMNVSFEEGKDGDEDEVGAA